MALTFEEITLRRITQDAIILSEEENETLVIPRSALTSFDIYHMERAEARIADEEEYSEVTNLIEALESYTMPNGQNAFDYYQPYVINLEDANERFLPVYEVLGPELLVRVRELEGRVETLEEEPEG